MQYSRIAFRHPFFRYRRYALLIYTLREKHVDCEVDETGKTAIENAILKAKAYYEQTHLKTIAIDDTLYIEGVTDEEQPGAKVSLNWLR